MKLSYWYLVMAVLSTCTANAEPAAPTLADRLAPCQKCHVGKLSLAGRPAEQTLLAVEQIRLGKKPHPPGLQTFTEEELVPLVEIVTRVIEE